jgi:hypothetical protein
MRAVEQAEHVELYHRLPFGQRRSDYGAQQHHAGVVDEGVEAAQLSDCALDGLGCLLLVGYI